jgi:hypothetical protein
MERGGTSSFEWRTVNSILLVPIFLWLLWGLGVFERGGLRATEPLSWSRAGCVAIALGLTISWLVRYASAAEPMVWVGMLLLAATYLLALAKRLRVFN